MYKTLLSAAFLGLTGVGGVYADISTVFSRVSQAAYPCKHTIIYSVATDPADPNRGSALAAVSDAAAWWDRAAGRVLFAYGTSGPDLIITIAATSSDPLWYEAGGTYASYESSLSGQEIAIAHLHDRMQFRHLLAHELGHALGLADSTSTDSLMLLNGTSTTPSREDAQAIQALCGENHAVIQ
jgi:hypothetical protein